MRSLPISWSLNRLVWALIAVWSSLYCSAASSSRGRNKAHEVLGVTEIKTRSEATLFCRKWWTSCAGFADEIRITDFGRCTNVTELITAGMVPHSIFARFVHLPQSQWMTICESMMLLGDQWVLTDAGTQNNGSSYAWLSVLMIVAGFVLWAWRSEAREKERQSAAAGFAQAREIDRLAELVMTLDARYGGLTQNIYKKMAKHGFRLHLLERAVQKITDSQSKKGVESRRLRWLNLERGTHFAHVLAQLPAVAVPLVAKIVRPSAKSLGQGWADIQNSKCTAQELWAAVDVLSWGQAEVRAKARISPDAAKECLKYVLGCTEQKPAAYL